MRNETEWADLTIISTITKLFPAILPLLTYVKSAVILPIAILLGAGLAIFLGAVSIVLSIGLLKTLFLLILIVMCATAIGGIVN